MKKLILILLLFPFICYGQFDVDKIADVDTTNLSYRIDTMTNVDTTSLSSRIDGKLNSSDFADSLRNNHSLIDADTVNVHRAIRITRDTLTELLTNDTTYLISVVYSPITTNTSLKFLFGNFNRIKIENNNGVNAGRVSVRSLSNFIENWNDSIQNIIGFNSEVKNFRGSVFGAVGNYLSSSSISSGSDSCYVSNAYALTGTLLINAYDAASRSYGKTGNGVLSNVTLGDDGRVWSDEINGLSTKILINARATGQTNIIKTSGVKVDMDKGNVGGTFNLRTGYGLNIIGDNDQFDNSYGIYQNWGRVNYYSADTNQFGDTTANYSVLTNGRLRILSPTALDNWGISMDPEEGILFTDGHGSGVHGYIYGKSSIMLSQNPTNPNDWVSLTSAPTNSNPNAIALPDGSGTIMLSEDFADSLRNNHSLINADTLIITDATLADSIRIFDDGTYSYFKTDNQLNFSNNIAITGTNKLFFGSDNNTYLFEPANDVLRLYIGANQKLTATPNSFSFVIPIEPNSDKGTSLGRNGIAWSDLYLGGSIKYGTTTLIDFSTVTNINIKPTLVTQDSLVNQRESSAILNDGIITLATGVAGWGSVYAVLTSTGAMIEWANFYFSEDGVVVLQTNSTNVTTTSGTASSLNIYDAGTGVVIENKLGARHTIKLDIKYSSN